MKSDVVFFLFPDEPFFSFIFHLISIAFLSLLPWGGKEKEKHYGKLHTWEGKDRKPCKVMLFFRNELNFFFSLLSLFTLFSPWLSFDARKKARIIRKLYKVEEKEDRKQCTVIMFFFLFLFCFISFSCLLFSFSLFVGRGNRKHHENYTNWKRKKKRGETMINLCCSFLIISSFFPFSILIFSPPFFLFCILRWTE